MRGVDYYELLGVDRSASSAEIKSAYRTLARTMHPDVGGTAGTFRLLQQAYETLNDPVRRADYDDPPDEPEPDPRPTGRDRSPSRRWVYRPGKRRDFGDDPNFTPPAPDLDPADIPWWDEVDPAERVVYLPVTAPDRTPALALAGGWVLLAATGLLVGLSGVLLGVWLAMLVSAGVVVLVLLRRLLEARRTDRLFEAENRGRVFGGTAEEEVAADGAVKQRSAELLADHLTRMPGVRIFHGVAWPGSVFADIDHAVLCGRRLVLVESKRWLPGHYEVDEDGEVWRNGHVFRGGTTRLANGVAAFEALLPEVEVRGVLLLYPNRAGEVTVGESDAEAPVEPLTPEGFVREVGEWLAEEPAAVDRDAFTMVLAQVVTR
ncbi:DnaJ domain-containing protein [Saccharopolyspora sp. NFXS83]|uniref:J domain-containing protein n=1 Tax=Saccharopolyspora sp. NFXS83 TaxID=2993560 RepID=UPI00224B2A78|nr:DnaJ domain-containing protein [Saccharopolyspora sp. NFXS83]MCX2733074.1 DnaJ domain-containing protein [Saccharopolyspora sp. NFXS83]